MNLLPVPRSLELTGDVVAQRTGPPAVDRSLPAQGYELHIDRVRRRARRGRRRGPLLRRGDAGPAGAACTTAPSPPASSATTPTSPCAASCSTSPATRCRRWRHCRP